MKKAIISLILSFIVGSVAFAQTTDDPAIQAAKEETVVIYDLGRLFGFLMTMENETPDIKLSSDQLEEIHAIMTKILNTDRMESDASEELLVHLEDDVLTPDQLMQVDLLAIAKEAARTDSSVPKGDSSGGGQIQTYVAGGAFNPMQDATKTMGEDFKAFYDYVAGKLGR